jgi:preprotein translocase subunit SecF
MHILNKTNINFMRWRWHAVALSWIVILAGLAVIATRGLPRGIEFAGGTSVIMRFDQPVSDDAVRTALNEHYPGGGSDAVVQTYGDPSLSQKMVRVPHVGEESGASLSTTATAVVDAMKAGGLAPEVIGTEIVGPAVGEELSQRGLIATVLSLVGLLLYIAFRYQLSFAVGAVVATIHDLLVVLAFLAFFRYDLTLNVIAAILTVTGYSTNDTIVIFDRVRENLRSMRRDSLSDVLNTAINQTLGRTVLTAGLTLLSVIALFFFGGEVLRGFAFTMIVGIITGTYSSVFVAAAVVSFWRGAGPTRAAAHAPTTSAPAVGAGTPQQPTRKAKPQRKARAS